MHGLPIKNIWRLEKKKKGTNNAVGQLYFQNKETQQKRPDL